MLAFSSSIFHKSSQSAKKLSRIKFSQSNLESLSEILDLLPEILLNTLGIIENWDRWSDMVAVKLPDIMSGSITLEKILPIRVLEWLVIPVGCKIKVMS